MAAMEGFDHVLNWKLKRGSHPFPGKDGGTCINEAALVAAGFPYRRIRCVDDMPSCFSRPICQLAMHLNDEASDVDRQRLLPFVTRLACADTAEVERARETHILSHVGRRLDFEDGLKLLESALAIGRQADPFAPEEVRTRMDAVRERVTTSKSGATTPFLSKVKSWFAVKGQVEPTA
jgi:hypothetical protein